MNALTFMRPRFGAYNLATPDGGEGSYRIVDSAFYLSSAEERSDERHEPQASISTEAQHSLSHVISTEASNLHPHIVISTEASNLHPHIVISTEASEAEKSFPSVCHFERSREISSTYICHFERSREISLDGADKIYLRSLAVPDNILDEIIERTLEKKCRLMIAVSRTLEEVGEFDARHGLSPVMFAHRAGLLENCAAVVGGVWLDKDDVDLLVQCDIPLVLTPSYDMGSGHGIPETSRYLSRGLKIALGTEDCSFNPEADVNAEARLLSLVTAATMRRPDALSDKDLKRMLSLKIE